MQISHFIDRVFFSHGNVSQSRDTRRSLCTLLHSSGRVSSKAQVIGLYQNTTNVISVLSSSPVVTSTTSKSNVSSLSLVTTSISG